MQKQLLAAGILTIAMPALAETPVLTVLTYDSFTSEWGPGPAVEKAFEATCACDLQFIPAGDGAALLARVQLEGAASDADILVFTAIASTPDEAALRANTWAQQYMSVKRDQAVADIAAVRAFNRLVTRQVGALSDRYLGHRLVGE